MIILNTVVNYFILLLSSSISKTEFKTIRIILGAFLGGIFSLYIFLPQQNIFLELILRIVMCCTITVTTFKCNSLKKLIRCTFSVLTASFIYAGAMIALWILIKPKGMVINNSVVYLNISPLFLILFFILFFFVFSFIKSVTKRQGSDASSCSLKIFIDERAIVITAILDTGNSVKDLFGNSQIIFVGRETFEKLLEKNYDLRSDKYKKRYRIVPCITVGGEHMLDGIRCDKAELYIKNDKIICYDPILVVSENKKICDEYQAILNPEILLLAE